MKLATLLLLALATLGTAARSSKPQSRISLHEGRWFINDKVTNPGSPAEGLLMNIRMVNATFEDRGKPDFDADANASRFIAQLDDYASHGVNAFTLCLQGGMPGYEGAVNSAFEADGSLRASYLARVGRVIRECDKRGLAVILGLFYQRQSSVLKDDDALRAGVVNAVKWVRDEGFENVLIEVANEYPHSGFAHQIIRRPEGMAGLIRLAKESAPGLLVSASGYGTGVIHDEVARASDFLLPHWNGTAEQDIAARIAALKKFSKPILCNEDDKTGPNAVAALQACVANGAGYGLMLKEHNQTVPFHFDGAKDDPVYYTALKTATSGKKAQAGSPGGNGNAFRGRIAYSADGNHNDPDDWIASPVSLAIIAEAGLRERLVHFDYNCILPQTDADFERKHAESVLGTAERYGFDRARFIDCRKELDRAVDDIAKAINESSADNPLWFIIAGPMEVPYLGIQKSDPDKRKFVTCVSHSRWNDGFASKYSFTHTKRSVIEQDVNWVQIRDQNKLLSLSKYGAPAKPQEFAGFFWMRDSQEPKVRWLWDRMLVSTRPDPSDAGMTWFLATGDEDCDPAKLKRLLEEHHMPTPAMRKQVRLEAENFRHLEGFVVEDRKDKKASHQLQAALMTGSGRIRTRFAELFAPDSGPCDIDVRFMDDKAAQPRLALMINGAAQGEPWESPGEGKGWTTHTVRGVMLRSGDEIAVDAQGAPARLDYVQLNFAGKARAETAGSAATSLRVAVVQMFLRPTITENRDRIVAGITQAAEKGARVAVFPERALSGIGGEPQEVVDEAVRAIRNAAKRHGINVVFGAHTPLASIKKDANWMLAIGADGRDLLRYEKLYENHHATMPGVFSVDGVPCSTMICADRWLRGVVELPIQQGAQISFELSNNYACEWVPEYGWYWNMPLARRNTVWSVLANSANEAAGVAAPSSKLNHGHSAVIAPDGRIIAAASGDTEELVVTDIDLSQATRASALARMSHPALHSFWDAGLKLHRGESIERPVFKPLSSKATDVTLAAAAVTGDFAQIEAMIREAHARKADLVAFPAQAFAEESLEWLKAAAKENEITVVAGTRHREGNGLRNSAYVIGPDGELLTRYDQLSAEGPFQPGTDAAAMWFRLKGAAAFVTIGRDALWSELSELAAVAGARIHIHLDHDADSSAEVRQQRLAIWANCATFATFTATVNTGEAVIWDDLQGREESRAVVKGLPAPDPGSVEVCPPFSANLVARTSNGKLVMATRHVPAVNPHHPARTSSLNPQMKAWYELGAALISPR